MRDAASVPVFLYSCHHRFVNGYANLPRSRLLGRLCCKMNSSGGRSQIPKKGLRPVSGPVSASSGSFHPAETASGSGPWVGQPPDWALGGKQGGKLARNEQNARSAPKPRAAKTCLEAKMV